MNPFQNIQQIMQQIMQNGTLNQQQVQDAYNNSVPPIQNNMMQN